MLVLLLLFSLSFFGFTEDSLDSDIVRAFASVEEGEEDSENQEDTFEKIKGVSRSRNWRAPNYSQQEGAIGWTESAFKIPEGLKPEVGFWIDIYSKYTTDQGVLHDIEDVTKIYEVLDFRALSARTDIHIYRKEALKIKAVKDAKKKLALKLKIKPEKIRFQLGQRDKVIQGIFYSGRYLEEFEETFRKHNVPIELTRMVFVESSFNVLARSKVGASGLWQLMPQTAKIYFKSDKYFDFRNHPTEATKAAAKFLRANFRLLKSWPLAITAYNHGPAGIKKIVKKYKTEDFEKLATTVSSRKSFGFASRNFFPSFLAILEVEKNAPKYLGPVKWSEKLGGVDLRAQRDFTYSELLKWFDGDKLTAQVYNPHITAVGRKSQRLPKGSLIHVPQERVQMAKADLAAPLPEPPLLKQRSVKVSERERRSEKN